VFHAAETSFYIFVSLESFMYSQPADKTYTNTTEQNSARGWNNNRGTTIGLAYGFVIIITPSSAVPLIRNKLRGISRFYLQRNTDVSLQNTFFTLSFNTI